jgi:hypothetical protein
MRPSVDAVPSDDLYVDSRRQLHGVAEMLIAGPQYRSHGTIRLRVTAHGFAGVEAPLAVEGMEFVWAGGRAPLRGSIADLAAAAGIEAGAPAGVYDSSGAVTEGAVLDLDAESVHRAQESLRIGANALTSFAGQDPVLWPEHFDVAVTRDEINYGVSPGDSYHPTPYAYIGPWTPRTGPFWNAPFGALLDMSVRADSDHLIGFFNEGRERSR